MMASKRRIRRRACTNKRRYVDRDEVEHSLVYWKRRGHRYTIYHCHHCGGWHLSKKKERV